MVDVQKIREDFPGLKNGRVFFDNAATTYKPQAVIRQISSFYTEEYASVYRGGYPSAWRAEEKLKEAREGILSFIGGTKSGELIFTGGATAAINHVASALAERSHGGTVVISALEHASNRLPWEHFCDRTGARLQVVGITDKGEVDADSFVRHLTPQTRIAAVTMMSNINGSSIRLEPVVRKAHELGVPVLADAAQAAAHMPVDVSALGVDFLCFSGHKLYGPMGIGGLYVRKERLKEFPCFFYGGGMAAQPVDSSEPEKWEAGTPNVAGILGLYAAVRYLQVMGWEQLLEREKNLAHMAVSQLRDCKGYEILAAGDSPVISLIPKFFSSYDLGALLTSSGFDVRTGNHCAQEAFKAFGERDKEMERYAAGSCRLSLSFYNTEEEVCRLTDLLHDIQRAWL